MLRFTTIDRLVVFLFGLLGASASADTITVCSSGGDHVSVNAAIDAASHGDVIQLSAEIYAEGVVIDSDGKAITLRGTVDRSGAATTILDGMNLHRVLECTRGETGTTVFENLPVRNGEHQEGGGMFNFQSSPALNNCRFSGNRCIHDGGGMFNRESSSPQLNDCEFLANSAYDDGGGMCNEESSSPTLVNCHFTGKWAENDAGGARFNDVSSSPSITGCTFTGNSAKYDGGAMQNEEFSNPSLNGCVFEANTGTYDGGAISNDESSPWLIDCVFEDNIAGRKGGGIFSGSDGVITIVDCRFLNNSAAVGGGSSSEYRSEPSLGNTVLCGNSPVGIAGGWTNAGGNCFRNIRQDDYRDGIPDCDGSPTDLELDVPGEYATIGLAIDAAAPGAVITIAAGTYQPVTTLDPIGKTISLVGSVDDAGFPPTIIDGEGERGLLHRVFGKGAQTVFENLLITGGRARLGGGINCFGSSPTLRNCVIVDNVACDGGGMANERGSSPSLHGCRFLDNTAEADGGGMWNKTDCSPTRDDCTFMGNAGQYFGGGMYNNIGCSPILSDGTVASNFSNDDGGGMYNGQGSSPILSDCTLSANTSGGGGMYNYDRSDPSLTDCTLVGNQAFKGAGMRVVNQCQPTLVGCTFKDNTAQDHGGGMEIGSSGGSASLIGCTFMNDMAVGFGNGYGGFGGGIFSEDAIGPELTDCNFCGNSVASGNCNVEGSTSVQSNGNQFLLNCNVGDVNFDLAVDSGDLGHVVALWAAGSVLNADLNNDGIVGGADLAYILG